MLNCLKERPKVRYQKAALARCVACETDDPLLDLLGGEAVVGRVDEAVARERVADGLHDVLGDVLVRISGNLGEIERLESRVVDYARPSLDHATPEGI